MVGWWDGDDDVNSLIFVLIFVLYLYIYIYLTISPLSPRTKVRPTKISGKIPQETKTNSAHPLDK